MNPILKQYQDLLFTTHQSDVVVPVKHITSLVNVTSVFHEKKLSLEQRDRVKKITITWLKNPSLLQTLHQIQDVVFKSKDGKQRVAGNDLLMCASSPVLEYSINNKHFGNVELKDNVTQVTVDQKTLQNLESLNKFLENPHFENDDHATTVLGVLSLYQFNQRMLLNSMDNQSIIILLTCLKSILENFDEYDDKQYFSHLYIRALNVGLKRFIDCLNEVGNHWDLEKQKFNLFCLPSKNGEKYKLSAKFLKAFAEFSGEFTDVQISKAQTLTAKQLEWIVENLLVPKDKEPKLKQLIIHHFSNKVINLNLSRCNLSELKTLELADAPELTTLALPYNIDFQFKKTNCEKLNHNFN